MKISEAMKVLPITIFLILSFTCLFVFFSFKLAMSILLSNLGLLYLYHKLFAPSKMKREHLLKSIEKYPLFIRDPYELLIKIDFKVDIIEQDFQLPASEIPRLLTLKKLVSLDHNLAISLPDVIYGELALHNSVINFSDSVINDKLLRLPTGEVPTRHLRFDFSNYLEIWFVENKKVSHRLFGFSTIPFVKDTQDMDIIKVNASQSHLFPCAFLRSKIFHERRFGDYQTPTRSDYDGSFVFENKYCKVSVKNKVLGSANFWPSDDNGDYLNYLKLLEEVISLQKNSDKIEFKKELKEFLELHKDSSQVSNEIYEFLKKDLK